MSKTDHHQVVVLTSEGMTKSNVVARQFTLQVDEPVTEGGTDTGPSPVEFLLTATAACLNYTCHFIAREMKFRLRDLKIRVEGDVDFARVIGLPTEKRAGFEAIYATIEVVSNADDNTIAEWCRRVEERCPVSDNLAQPTPLRIKANVTAPLS